MMDVVVIGGGMAGLSCGLTLSAGHDLLLVEKDQDLGGLCSSFQLQGLNIPRYCHNLLSTDKVAIELWDQLGLQGSIRWERVDTLLGSRERLWDVSSPRGILSLGPIPLGGRLRLGLLSLQALMNIPQGPMEGISAKDWLVSRIGSQATDGFFEPLCWVKYKQGLGDISASWLWDRFVKSAKMGNRTAILGGGLRRAVKAMEMRMRDNGACIRTMAKASSVQAKDGRYRVTLRGRGGEETVDCDAVVVCLPAPLMADILPLSGMAHRRLSMVAYKAIVNACFVLNAPLLERHASIVFPYGDSPFGGLIHHFLDRYGGPGDRSLVYVYSYLDPSDPLYLGKEKDVLHTIEDALEPIFPGFKGRAVDGRISRSMYASPVFSKGFSRLLVSDEDLPPGIFQAGAHLLYPNMPTIGSAVESGLNAARLAVSYLDAT